MTALELNVDSTQQSGYSMNCHGMLFWNALAIGVCILFSFCSTTHQTASCSATCMIHHTRYRALCCLCWVSEAQRTICCCAGCLTEAQCQGLALMEQDTEAQKKASPNMVPRGPIIGCCHVFLHPACCICCIPADRVWSTSKKLLLSVVLYLTTMPYCACSAIQQLSCKHMCCSCCWSCSSRRASVMSMSFVNSWESSTCTNSITGCVLLHIYRWHVATSKSAELLQYVFACLLPCYCTVNI